MPRFRPAAALAALAVTAGAFGVLPGAQAAVDPIDGPQTSGDTLFPHVGNGGYDVSHYDLDIAWTPGVTLASSTIDATAEIEAATTGAPLRSFSFDFEYPTVTVESVTVNGEAATFAKDENVSAIKHKLVVTPAAPVEGVFTTVVEYSGVPVRHTDADGSFEGWNVTADGATFVNQPIGSMTGFPNNNTPNDKATYDISIDIPNTITNSAGTGNAAAASNGELVSRDANGDSRTTWNWEQTKPMASELVVISIGKYDVLESDVTLASGRTLHEWSFVDSASSTNNKNSINVQRARFKSVIDGLETIYGPYPGESIGVIVDIVPSAINYALETQDRSFFPTNISAGTFVHEMAHQWYGNHVAPTVWNDLYINEGMATWAPTYFANELAEPATSGATTEGTYYTSWASSAPESSNWLTPPAGITNAAQLYGYQTYTRSAQFWEALRLSIGDEAFFTLIEEWQTRYAGESRGTADLLALAEEISGRELDAFFQDWVFDADKPAWPQSYHFTLSDEGSSTPLAPGETVTYRLTATNRGFVPLTSSVVEVDLSDVLDDASLDPSTLPEGATLDSGTGLLTWTVPATARRGSRTAEFTVVVDGDASSTALVATAGSRTLGGFCVPGARCTSTLVVPSQPVTGTPVPPVPPVTDTPVPPVPPVTGTPDTSVQPVTGTPDPSVRGIAKVGRPLTVDPGAWDGNVSVQWYRNSRPIADATGVTHRLVAADLGKDVTALVSYSKAGYTAVAKPAVIEDVRAGAMTRRPVPRITGRAMVRKVLTAVPRAHDAGSTVRYQWLANGDAIKGATSRTFKIPARYRGDRIQVRTITSKPGYQTLTRTSAATARVV